MAFETANISIMEALPIELIHIISSFMPIPDLGNFRLASKDCAKASERHLVRDLHVMFTTKSFQNLLQISRHPILSQYVSSLFYEVRFLEDVDQQEYMNNILENEDFEEMYAARSVIEIARGWTVYKPMLDEQKYMLKTSFATCAFTQALARFPHLKRIEMGAGYALLSAQMTRAYAPSLAIGLMLDAGDLLDEQEPGVRALSSLLIAASAMSGRLESLNAHSIHWSFFNPAPSSLNFSRQAFTHLRHLDLVLEADYDDFDNIDTVQARHAEFGRALRSATALESLHLAFDDIDIVPQSVLIQRQMNVPVVWETLTEDMAWPNLRSLELCVVTCSGADLTNFLMRHAKTLKVVKWYNIWLTESASRWNSLFKKMQRNLKLEELIFGGVFGADGSDGMPQLLKMDGEFGSKLTRSILRGGREKRRKGKRSGQDGDGSNTPEKSEAMDELVDNVEVFS
jgi:hypothetical protein